MSVSRDVACDLNRTTCMRLIEGTNEYIDIDKGYNFYRVDSRRFL